MIDTEAVVTTFYATQLLFAAVATAVTVVQLQRGLAPPRIAVIIAISTGAALAIWAALSEQRTALVNLIPYYPDQGFFRMMANLFGATFFWLSFGSLLDWAWPAKDKLATRTAEPLIGPPKKEETRALVIRPERTVERSEREVVGTAMDYAPTIRNPLAAFANTVGTNAQITALENAGRLADATARTAEAEAKGFDAILRREDRLIELRVRQQIATELEQNKIEEQRSKLIDDAHRRTIAAERRTKDRWDAKRDTANARHGLEAANRFKEAKFKLGEKRAQARMADVDVDTATAQAASRKLGGADEKDAAAVLIDLRELAETIRQQVLMAAAEGQDATLLREHLARIEGMLPE
jgi:hypothetical protein